MPQKMRVSNQGEYNKFLEERGNIFHFIDGAIKNWYESSPKVAGGNNVYSDKVVILIHIIVHLFRIGIGLRQAVGFIKGYLEKIEENLEVISYSQASRRLTKLNMKISDHRTDKNDIENIEIAIDSTSINIYNNSDQHNKKYAKERRYNHLDQVRKLHVVLNIKNKEVIAMGYTNAITRDSTLACSMLKKIENKYNILSLYADAFYDATNVYKICKKYNIKPIVRPRKDAKIYEKVDYLSERNKNINVIRSYENYNDGIAHWKKKTKYGARSYVESFFLRLKKTFGFSFKNKSEINREKELSIKCYLMNKFTKIGIAKFEMVM